MGRARRPIPKKLGVKLYIIRKRFNLTLQQMIDRLDYKETPIFPSYIAEFETGQREPPLPVLLRYARLIGQTIDVLADDQMNLPDDVTAVFKVLNNKELDKMDELMGFTKSKKRKGSKRKSR